MNAPDTAEALEPLPWHTDQWQRLTARRQAGNLPHALLIAGPAGVGKTRFAQRLANALVCTHDDPAARPCGACQACHLARTGAHPDLFWVTPEEPGRPIRIDAIRDLIERAALTTQASGERVFVIAPADALNRAAANALLKTLEEPTEASRMLLVSSAPHRLPATILSRCQRVSFRPVPPERGREWLAARGVEGDLDAALAASGGAPLAALAMLEEAGLARLEQRLDDLAALASRRADPLQTAAAWAEDSMPALLADLRRVAADLVRLGAGGEGPRLYLPGRTSDLQKTADHINLQKLFHFLDEVNRLERQLVNNLNPQMLTEKLVNDWLSLTRPEKR